MIGQLLMYYCFLSPLLGLFTSLYGIHQPYIVLIMYIECITQHMCSTRVTTVENSIMHTVRRCPILCIIKYMHYQICRVLHELIVSF